MNREEIQVLKQDVVIPEVVQQKVEETLRSIINASNANIEEQTAATGMRRRTFRMPRVAAVLAATLVFGTVSVAAGVYYRWNHGLEQTLHVAEEEKEIIEGTGVVDRSESNRTATCNGITVTVEQTLVDNYNAYAAFRVEGLVLNSETTEPSFDKYDIRLFENGKEIEYGYSSMGASFYNGWHIGPDGTAWNEDGLRAIDNPSLPEVYRQKDGSYILLMNIFHDERGAFLGKEIECSFKDLGTVAKASHETTVEGEWTLRWQLKGTPDSETFQMKEALGDTGAIVTEIELSPISIRIDYNWPRQRVEKSGEDAEAGETVSYGEYADPPHFMGVKTADGAIHLLIGGSGKLGYPEETGDLWQAVHALDEIILVEDVTDILFLKESWENGTVPTEENFYLVPVR